MTEARSVAALDGGEPRIDSFLMSCRVLGRGIEVAMLSLLLSRLARLGDSRCAAEYIPSGRNGMAESFLEDNGFAADGDRLVIDLNRAPVVPHWIEVKDE